MMVAAIRNGLWQASTQMATYIAGVIGSIIVVRSLTPEAYGMFSYYAWWASVVGVFGTLAFPTALTKIKAELRGRQQQSEARALAFRVIFTVVLINLAIGAGLLIWALGRPEPERNFLLVISAVQVPFALVTVLRSNFFGSERYRPIFLTGATASFVQLALIGVVSLAGWGAVGFLAVVLSASVIQAVGLMAILISTNWRSFLTIIFQRPSRVTQRHYLEYFFPSFLAMLSTMIVWERSEVFFLERFASIEQIGYYSLAYTMFTMILSLGLALANGLLTAISRNYGASEWGAIKEHVRRGLVLVTLYAVPFSFGGWATLDRLILLLYGPQMLPAVPVAQMLFASLYPGVVAGVLGLTLGATNGIWMSVRVGFVLSITNIGLDLLLIPRFGAIGGAVANATSQIIFCLILFGIVSRVYKVEVPGRRIIMLIIIGLFTTFLLPKIVEPWLPEIWGLAITIIMSGCLYAATVWRLGYFKIFWRIEAA